MVLEVYDVKAAFLNANPGSKMYIKIPEERMTLGFVIKEEQKEYAIQLENKMYGNVDATLHVFDKYSGILKDDLGIKQSDSDPCIFLKRDMNRKLVIVISMYVDDSLLVVRRSGWNTSMKNFLSISQSKSWAGWRNT